MGDGESEGTLENTVKSAYENPAEAKGGDGAYLMEGSNPTEMYKTIDLPQTAYTGGDGASLMSGASPDYVKGMQDAIKAMMEGLLGGNMGSYMPLGGMNLYGNQSASQLDMAVYGTQPMKDYSADEPAADVYQSAGEGTYEGSSGGAYQGSSE